MMWGYKYISTFNQLSLFKYSWDGNIQEDLIILASI